MSNQNTRRPARQSPNGTNDGAPQRRRTRRGPHKAEVNGNVAGPDYPADISDENLDEPTHEPSSMSHGSAFDDDDDSGYGHQSDAEDHADHEDDEDDGQLAFLGRKGDLHANARPDLSDTPGRRQLRGGNNARGGRGKASGEALQEGERIQKVLAAAGYASRREVEEWIMAGRVSVNGLPSFLGQKIAQGDRVKVNGKLINVRFAERAPRVIIYHKPEGEIVSKDDPEGRPSVFERLPNLRRGRWIAIGRLDFNTSGLLLFTDNGDLANKLMHPRYNFDREYAVRILGDLTDEHKQQLTTGIELEDGPAKFNMLREDGGEGANKWFRVVISEGRNREVRRMFEALGLTVSRLMRVRYGPVALPPRLKRGMFEDMTPEMVKSLVGKENAPKPGKSEGGQARRSRNRRGPKSDTRNGTAPGPRAEGAETGFVPVATMAEGGAPDAPRTEGARGEGRSEGDTQQRRNRNRRGRGGRNRRPKPAAAEV